ncbi:MAG TPA: RtcB family protein [Polyangia bacterium]|nr:RtcB family protein [Polyangia bacterium]
MLSVSRDKGGVPIKWWTAGVPVEDQARAQVERIAALPFIHAHVAVMPDVHLGKGATVGSVIATRGAIIPAAVGVDIGCGMMAARTNLNARDLPNNLGPLRTAIERAIPHGRTDNGGRNDRGARRDLKGDALSAWRGLQDRFDVIVGKHPKLGHGNSGNHMGTLGTGNHFIEVCLDEHDAVWVMLHSGSRGVGNRIGTYFIERAKADMGRLLGNLPDADLAYLREGTASFDDYVEAVSWAQDFATANRDVMMTAALGQVAAATRGAAAVTEQVVACHHNYVAREHHFGADVLVTRKGAVSARQNQLGIIPGSMGTRSFIVRGKGNRDSFESCSHGAGRVMSRNEARRRFTVADHRAATAGVECRKDADVVDETPAAYKPIDAVMAAQADLVDVVHTLRQVLCVKG